MRTIIANSYHLLAPFQCAFITDFLGSGSLRKYVSRALLLCFEADLTFLRKEQKVLLTMWQGWVGAGGRDSDKVLNMKGSDEVFSADSL